jgi:hypothetical protein
MRVGCRATNRARSRGAIDPQLRDQDLRGPGPDARDRVEARGFSRERAQGLLDLGREIVQRLIQVVQMGEQMAYQPAVMLAEASHQGLPQGGELAPELALREVR